MSQLVRISPTYRHNGHIEGYRINGILLDSSFVLSLDFD